MLKFTTARAVLLGINILLHVDMSKSSYFSSRGYFRCKNKLTAEGRLQITIPNVADVYTAQSINCLVDEGNLYIQDGSSKVNANCTKKYSCVNGIAGREDYRCSPHAVCEQRSGLQRCYCSNDTYGEGTNCYHGTECRDIFNNGFTASGVYSIKPTNWSGPAFNVLCEMNNGGGWTVFQRRVNGTVDFYRNWTSYKNGFGDLDREFWLGNDKLHHLTNQGNYALRIDLVNNLGDPYYAEYDMFLINDESDNYRLSELGVYSGTAGIDSLRDHLNHSFSTFDRDNDGNSGGNCALDYHGGWWYSNCRKSNLNGDYDGANNPSTFWQGLPGNPRNLRRTEMKIRPK